MRDRVHVFRCFLRTPLTPTLNLKHCMHKHGEATSAGKTRHKAREKKLQQQGLDIKPNRRQRGNCNCRVPRSPGRQPPVRVRFPRVQEQHKPTSRRPRISVEVRLRLARPRQRRTEGQGGMMNPDVQNLQVLTWDLSRAFTSPPISTYLATSLKVPRSAALCMSIPVGFMADMPDLEYRGW